MNKTTTVGVEFRAYNHAKAGLRSFTSSLGTVRRSVARYGTTLLGAAGVGGVGYLIGQQFKAIDSIGKMSDELQISTKALSGWTHAAEISGTNIETLHKGLQIFVRRIGEAQQGLGEARHGLDAIGMSAEQLAQQGPERAFLTIAEAIKDIPTATDRAQVAYAFFGRQGMNMLNLFLQGKDGIQGLADEADRLGLSFSRLDAAKVEMANDALTRMRNAFTGLARTVTIQLSPYVISLADQLTDATVSGRNFADNLVYGFEAATMGIAKLKAPIAEVIRMYEWVDKHTRKTLSATELERQTYARYRQTYPDDARAGKPRGLMTISPGLQQYYQPKYPEALAAIREELRRQYEPDTFMATGGSAIDAELSGIRDWFDALRRRAQLRMQQVEGRAPIGTGQGVASPVEPGSFGDDGASALTTMDAATAYRRMAKDLDRRSGSAYMAKLRLLQGEFAQYGSVLGNDPALAEWWQQRHRNLEIDRLKGTDEWQGGFRAAALESQRDMQTLGEAGYDVASGWSDAFGSFFRQMRTDFKDIDQLAENLLDQMAAAVWEATVVKPLTSAISQSLGSALTPNALGNVYRYGHVQAFGSGAVLSGPTVFPMADGQVGLAGEAGYEAFLPLGRMRDGTLGVHADGSGSQPGVEINIDNGSSAQVEAAPGDVTFDGRRYVVGLMLKDKRNNGPITRAGRRR